MSRAIPRHKLAMTHHLRARERRAPTVARGEQEELTPVPSPSPSSPSSSSSSSGDSQDSLGNPGQRITDTFWPSLKQALGQGDGAWKRLSLDCGICLEKLDVQKSLHGYHSDDESDHIPKIMPCGHIYGLSCIQNMIANRETDDAEVVCPACREFWSYTHCNHVNLGRHFPRPFREDMDWVPQVIIHGGSLSSQCTECSVKSCMHSLLDLAATFFDGNELEEGERIGIMVDTGHIIIKMVDGRTPNEGFSYSKKRRLDLQPPLTTMVEVVTNSLNTTIRSCWGGGPGDMRFNFEFFAFKIRQTQRTDRNWEKTMWVSRSKYLAWDSCENLFYSEKTPVWWT
ncbi:hypothetical protein BGZ63DRAFT_373327 [Mariannaea sp. PMI_226]|nr:hypothetical protein BGZ63DRAFT_373327 [Mariannaea sp. PMI_226]